MPSDDEAELTTLVQCKDENGDQKLDEREFWRLLSDQRLLSTSAGPAGSGCDTGTVARRGGGVGGGVAGAGLLAAAATLGN